MILLLRRQRVEHQGVDIVVVVRVEWLYCTSLAPLLPGTRVACDRDIKLFRSIPSLCRVEVTAVISIRCVLVIRLKWLVFLYLCSHPQNFLSFSLSRVKSLCRQYFRLGSDEPLHKLRVLLCNPLFLPLLFEELVAVLLSCCTIVCVGHVWVASLWTNDLVSRDLLDVLHIFNGHFIHSSGQKVVFFHFKIAVGRPVTLNIRTRMVSARAGVGLAINIWIIIVVNTWISRHDFFDSLDHLLVFLSNLLCFL